MKGYKATDKDMKCRGYQFKIGEWFETKEPLELCRSGFHFCKYPSGVFSYYDAGCRVFEVEAEGILEAPVAPGADYKLVCSKIKFLREIFPDGNSNTGAYNTGHSNTGHRNTGHSNTGNGNTGHRNTGDCNTGEVNTGHHNSGGYNTGDGNTGDYNTGHRNTGHSNTGDGNTGHRNTGHRNTGNYNTGRGNTGKYNTGEYNTGDYNTGDYNTGDHNTGHRNTGRGNTGRGNAGDHNTGFFCQKKAKIFCFDIQTDMSREEFVCRHPEVNYLLERLFNGEVDWEKVKSLPGITKKKLKSLLDKHRKAREVTNE